MLSWSGMYVKGSFSKARSQSLTNWIAKTIIQWALTFLCGKIIEPPIEQKESQETFLFSFSFAVQGTFKRGGEAMQPELWCHQSVLRHPPQFHWCHQNLGGEDSGFQRTIQRGSRPTFQLFNTGTLHPETGVQVRCANQPSTHREPHCNLPCLLDNKRPILIRHVLCRIQADDERVIFCNGLVLHRLQCLSGFGEWIHSIMEFGRGLHRMELDISSLACMESLVMVTRKCLFWQRTEICKCLFSILFPFLQIWFSRMLRCLFQSAMVWRSQNAWKTCSLR